MKNICNNIKDKMFAYLEGTLSDKASISIKSHIKNCTDCQKELKIVENILVDLWEIKTFSDPSKILKKLHKKIESRESERIQHINAKSADDLIKKIKQRTLEVGMNINVEVVIPSNCVSEAMTKLKKELKKIDLILMDITMPSKEGMEMLNNLKKEVGNKKVIILTSVNKGTVKEGYTQLKICVPAGNKI